MTADANDTRRRLRVLVVDDSAHNRRTIADILDSHPDLEVVGMADDGEKGLKAATALKPDLITLDLEMPRMDGFTFLRIMMSQMPTPIIVISSESRKQSVFQCLELGALDFIVKPARYFAADETALRDQIITKALAVRALQVIPFSKRSAGRSEVLGAGEARGAAKLTTSTAAAATSSPDRGGRVGRVVCIGASTGGPPALQAIFKALSSEGTVAYLVAQHMPEKFTRAFAERLNRCSALQIQEAQDGMLISAGNAYVAAGGTHLEVAPAPGGRYAIKVVPSIGGDRYTPSIDRLFRSAAVHFGPSTLAVVLTGMGSDGSDGVRGVREAGGQSVAESQETAIVYGMPKEAQSTGCIDEVLALDAVIERIVAFARSG